MSRFLSRAVQEDATEIAALRASVAADLTLRYGKGPWSSSGTVKGVRFDMKRGAIFIARRRGAIIASLTLETRKPWAIDPSYFSPIARPLYLTGMAVAPRLQRKGIGRRTLRDVRIIARQWPADAIRLDAYDSPAGAGHFYAACGFREVGRATYRKTPLVYFELLA